MEKNSRKLLVIALAMLALSLSVAGSLAYFSETSEIVHNVITTGNIHVRLVEKSIVDGVEKDFEDVDGAMPGEAISKIVKLENTGTNPAFVRLAVTKNIRLAEGKSGIPDLDLIEIDFNTTDWTDGEDGWYYYNRALNPGETTEPLFTTVKMKETMGNLYQGCVTTVTVAGQAVQTANNGSSARTAAGWPAV